MNDNNEPWTYDLEPIYRRRTVAFGAIQLGKEYSRGQWEGHVNILSHIKNLDMMINHLKYESTVCRRMKRATDRHKKLIPIIEHHMDEIEKLTMYLLMYAGGSKDDR